MDSLVEKQKTPVPQGKTGVEAVGTPERNRTPNLQIRSLNLENHNANNDNKLGVNENPMYTLLDTQAQRRPCSNKSLGKNSESISVPKSPGFSP
ncbi:MAG: hypothetical protein LBU64_00055, partial [Planctomycetota bacterium]|nr:hypothetical protein [Planctomycetota bacterium]